MKNLNDKLAAHAKQDIQSGNRAKGLAELETAKELTRIQSQIDEHLANVQQFRGLAQQKMERRQQTSISLLQRGSGSHLRRGPEDDLAKEMTHDLEMNFNKIAPFGK